MFFWLRSFILILMFAAVTACGGGSGGANSSAPAPSLDYDNDGVPNAQDAFPNDPKESADTDKDGVGDNADVAPKDALCSAASDAEAGVCTLRTLAGAQFNVVAESDGKIFFVEQGSATPRIYAYDIVTAHFLGHVSINTYTPASFAYSDNHQRLYVGDSSGKIHSYSASLAESANVFATTPLSVRGLVAVGKYLMAQDASGGWATHYVYDKLGNLTDSKDLSAYSRYYEWNAAQSRVYFFRDDTSPNDLMFEKIEQSTGKITDNGETPYHGAYSIEGPIRASQSGTKVLLGSGDVYLAPLLTWDGSVGVGPNDALWLASGELVTASNNTGSAYLRRFDANKKIIEQGQIDGNVLRMLTVAGKNYLVVKKTANIEIRSYAPNNDSDGDGVDNLTDKFPNDKAAALDSDNDGYPDAWIAGRSAADSTTGLTLDAYPFDAACHLATEGNGTNCNYATAIPAYVPDRVVSDNQDTLFMLSATDARVYRWSKKAGGYIAPFVVGLRSGAGAEMPTLMTYSQDHDRLYFGYTSGAITYIALSGDSTEKRLTTTSRAVKGLASAGKYLLAQDYSGAWATHYLFDKSGALTDSKDWNYYSSFYEWSASQARIYFLGSDTHLMFENIDQATGKIIGKGETYYSTNSPGPIRFAALTARILLNNGNVYSSDLTVVDWLGAGFIDAQWLDDGTLVTMTAGIDTNITRYTANLVPSSEQNYAGTPQSLQKLGNTIILVTQKDGKPNFQVLP